MLIAPETIPSAETIFAKVIRNKEFSFNDLQNYHTPIEWSSIFKYISWQLSFSYTVYTCRCQDNNGHVSIIRSHYINSYKECLEKGQKTKTCSAVTYNSGYCTLHRLVNFEWRLHLRRRIKQWSMLPSYARYSDLYLNIFYNVSIYTWIYVVNGLLYCILVDFSFLLITVGLCRDMITKCLHCEQMFTKYISGIIYNYCIDWRANLGNM